MYDEDVDAAALCRRAEELFELYQHCANRRQIETIRYPSKQGERI